MSADERQQDDAAREPEGDVGRRHTGNLADDKHPVPLFLKGRKDGRHDDAQDEKAGSAE